MSSDVSDNKTPEQQRMETWPDLFGQLFDGLTRKEAVISYRFRNLELAILRAVGPGGQSLGSAKCILNGDLEVNAQFQKSQEIER
jgi:hypothetical protein